MRGKLLIVLIIYFAGFFSAIYIMTPGGEDSTTGVNDTREYAIDGQDKVIKAKDIAQKVGTGMRKFLCVAGEKASLVSEKIKAKLDEQDMK